MDEIADIYQSIRDERTQQDAKWGEQNHDDMTWLAILTEEIGEVAQAALHDRFGGRAAGTLPDELIQAAAAVVAWLECIERRETSEH
jgi:NTP pyrophosphatase (non-canonical NTP hydrolase)